jgi:hypothetical protein
MTFHSPAPMRRVALAWLLVFAVTITSLPMVVTAQTATPASATTTPPAATPTPDNGSQSEIAPELPPADLPTLNAQGYTFAFKSSLRTDLDSVPREAPVYALQRIVPTRETAEKLQKNLGVTGELVDQGSNVWLATGDGTLFVSADFIQYTSTAVAKPGTLPPDDQAIEIAREWLRTTDLAPADLGDGKVAQKSPEIGRMTVTFGPAEPANLLASYPTITVTISTEGNVLESSVRWAMVGRGDIYQLRTAEDAWQQILTGAAFVEADIADANVPPGSIIEGNASYNNVTLAYTTAGPPGGQQYLVPVFVFRGRVRLTGGEVTYAIRGFVPALANSGAPVG